MEEQYSESHDALGTHDHDDEYYTKALADALCYHMVGGEAVPDGLDADKVDGQHASDLFGASLPAGAILMYSGSDAEVPDGWHVCDGSGGTPDCRDRFVVGAGGAYGVGATGGSLEVIVTGSVTVQEHALTLAEIPSHRHAWTDNYMSTDTTRTAQIPYDSSQPKTNTSTSGKPSDSTGDGEAHGHTESTFTATAPTDNRPIYYALYYIMKV